jgi:uncharacterized coiled-coil protein SlyX
MTDVSGPKIKWETIVATSSLLLSVTVFVIGVLPQDVDVRIAEIESENRKQDYRLDEVERKIVGRRDFMNDAATRLNFLCQDSVACRNYYGALRIPE